MSKQPDSTPKDLVPFSKLKQTMQSGDIILMHGQYTDSWLIEDFERSIWTHSGIILKAKDIGLEGKVPDLLFWESNSLTNLPDLILNKTKTGPMLVDLDKRVVSNAKDYNEVKMAYVELSVERKLEFWQKLLDFMPTVHNAIFPSDIKMMFYEIEGRIFRHQTGMKEIFCSELVAGSYESMGLLNNDWPWNAYEPGDFAKKGKVDLQLNAHFEAPLEFDPLS